ncbi:MAG TPA: DUF58 domain-containing protein [Candidatus Saccharimonadales bacterium]|nr:DUF58 domain-containing protein [Candidatus Saccharimonadales bacterium]
MAEKTQLLDASALNRLMHLTLLARSPMEGSVTGLHKSPHRGSSVEFAEYRNYVPGDDIRRLDWRVFARTDRFYLKEYEAETNLRCYVVLDCSGSMKFGDKLGYARKMSATLSYLAAHQGDAVGLVCAGEKAAVEIPPRRHPSHLKLIFDTLEKVEARGETGLVAALHDLAEKVRRRALVVVISDFFCDLEPLLNCFQHLRFQKHDLALFQLLDRAEMDFQFDRPVRFVDLESSLSIVTEPSTIRDEYLRQLHSFLDQLRNGCHEFGADYRQVITDEGYERVLADFVVERARLAAQ